MSIRTLSVAVAVSAITGALPILSMIGRIFPCILAGNHGPIPIYNVPHLRHAKRNRYMLQKETLSSLVRDSGAT